VRRRRVSQSTYILTGQISGVSPEARLAAGVLGAALEDARAGDVEAAKWLTSPISLEPWAGVLRIEAEDLARVASRTLTRIRIPTSTRIRERE
jgi:hypothetical protein